MLDNELTPLQQKELGKYKALYKEMAKRIKKIHDFARFSDSHVLDDNTRKFLSEACYGR